MSAALRCDEGCVDAIFCHDGITGAPGHLTSRGGYLLIITWQDSYQMKVVYTSFAGQSSYFQPWICPGVSKCRHRSYAAHPKAVVLVIAAGGISFEGCCKPSYICGGNLGMPRNYEWRAACYSQEKRGRE